jgi:deoxycytidylate deaminase
MKRKRYVITASAFDKKGKLLSVGQNEYNRSHPLFKHFAVLAGESEEKIYKHAEFSACLAAGNKAIYSVFVQRYDSFGNPANAEPCRACKLLLKHFGVTKVRYTTKEGIKEVLVSSWTRKEMNHDRI